MEQTANSLKLRKAFLLCLSRVSWSAHMSSSNSLLDTCFRMSWSQEEAGTLLCWTSQFNMVWLTFNSLSDLNVQVESIIEVSAPEEVGEAKADVKGTELFLTQREQSEDVHKVLVPPEHDVHYNRQLSFIFLALRCFLRSLFLQSLCRVTHCLCLILLFGFMSDSWECCIVLIQSEPRTRTARSLIYTASVAFYCRCNNAIPTSSLSNKPLSSARTHFDTM